MRNCHIWLAKLSQSSDLSLGWHVKGVFPEEPSHLALPSYINVMEFHNPIYLYSYERCSLPNVLILMQLKGSKPCKRHRQSDYCSGVFCLQQWTIVSHRVHIVRRQEFTRTYQTRFNKSVPVLLWQLDQCLPVNIKPIWHTELQRWADAVWFSRGSMSFQLQFDAILYF